MASEIRVNKLNSQTGVGTITLSPTGVDISGVTTVSTLRSNIGIFSGTITGEHHGDGSNLTGVASTENIRTNTNATFLQNINVSGTSTVAGTSTANLFSGSGASLTSLPAANLTGALPAISAASLTSVPAANYSFWCENITWKDSEGNVAGDGRTTGPGVYDELTDTTPSTDGYTKSVDYSVRYTELLSFVAAYNEQRFTSIESRLDAAGL